MIGCALESEDNLKFEIENFKWHCDGEGQKAESKKQKQKAAADPSTALGMTAFEGKGKRAIGNLKWTATAKAKGHCRFLDCDARHRFAMEEKATRVFARDDRVGVGGGH